MGEREGRWKRRGEGATGYESVSSQVSRKEEGELEVRLQLLEDICLRMTQKISFKVLLLNRALHTERKRLVNTALEKPRLALALAALWQHRKERGDRRTVA